MTDDVTPTYQRIACIKWRLLQTFILVVKLHSTDSETPDRDKFLYKSLIGTTKTLYHSKMDRSVLMSLCLFFVAVFLFNCVVGMGDSKQSSFGDYPAANKYQDWYEWLVKRNFGGLNRGFGVQDNGKFLDWESMLKSGLAKRQLSVTPDRFGNYGGYFSSGLQDWRRAFTGSKRQSNTAK